MSDPVETTDRAHDRLALRQLVETYAHAADRRKNELSGSLFTSDGLLAIYDGDARGQASPTRTRRGPQQIAEAMCRLKRYSATTHIVGQQTVEFDPADPHRATGETYCLAHHVTETDDGPIVYIMSIRYLDRYLPRRRAVELRGTPARGRLDRRPAARQAR